MIHRDGGLPAIEMMNGTREWWVNNKPHRDGGLPAIEHADGSKEWWVHGNIYVKKKIKHGNTRKIMTPLYYE